MPGYDQFERMSREIPAAVKSGALDATWRDGIARVLPGWQALPVHADNQNGVRGSSGGGRAVHVCRTCAPRSRERPAGRRRGITRRKAESRLSRPERLHKPGDRRLRERSHARRQREGSDQERHRELGLRRGAGANDGDVVVARQQPARLLPVRRDKGSRLLRRNWIRRRSRARWTPRPTRRLACRIRSSTCTSTTSRPRSRRVSTCGTDAPSTISSSVTTCTASPGRRTAVSCCSTAPTGDRTFSSSRPRIPPPARPASSCTRSGRRGGSRTARRCSSWRTAGASSGSRRGTAGATTTSTISAAN